MALVWVLSKTCVVGLVLLSISRIGSWEEKLKGKPDEWGGVGTRQICVPLHTSKYWLPSVCQGGCPHGPTLTWNHTEKRILGNWVPSDKSTTQHIAQRGITHFDHFYKSFCCFETIFFKKKICCIYSEKWVTEWDLCHSALFYKTI